MALGHTHVLTPLQKKHAFAVLCCAAWIQQRSNKQQGTQSCSGTKLAVHKRPRCSSPGSKVGHSRLDRQRTPCMSARSLKTASLCKVGSGALRMPPSKWLASIAVTLACTRPLAMSPIPAAMTTNTHDQYWVASEYVSITTSGMTMMVRQLQIPVHHVIHAVVATIRDLEGIHKVLGTGKYTTDCITKPVPK